LNENIKHDLKEFSEKVEELHKALLTAIEEVEKDRDLGHAELMCALSGLLCGVAAESGFSHEEFLTALSLHFATKDEIPPKKSLH
jgi:hypothetical protein